MVWGIGDYRLCSRPFTPPRRDEATLDHTSITERDMIQAAEQFHEVYPLLLEEIDRIEALRGELNDFQLMLAVSKAKDSMGIMSWERRRLINAIFETYMDVYRMEGRSMADQWVVETFEMEPASLQRQLTAQKEGASRIEELSRLIMERESELLQLYRELHALQGWQLPVSGNDMEKEKG